MFFKKYIVLLFSNIYSTSLCMCTQMQVPFCSMRFSPKKVCIGLQHWYFKRLFNKLLHRGFYFLQTFCRLQKMFPIVSGLCWRCQVGRDSFVPVWWECRFVKIYQRTILNCVRKIIHYETPLSNLCGHVRKEHMFLVVYLFMAAQIIVIQNWKSAQLQTVKYWLRKVDLYIAK